MWKSFGGASGGMGGGGGPGGSMLRTVHRAVRTGVGGGATQEPFSQSATKKPKRPAYKPRTTSSSILSFTSSTAAGNTAAPFSTLNLPVSTGPTWPPSPTCSDYEIDDQWECVTSDDGLCQEEERVVFSGVGDDLVFGSVPSKDEVQLAVSTLQQLVCASRVLDPASYSQVMKDRLDYHSDKDVADRISSPTGTLRRVSSVGSECSWIEPSLQQFNSRMPHSRGSERVLDAFHLLQTEPSVQKMVISLSSDKAVWNAVLNNEAVQELRQSLGEADKNIHGSLEEGSDGSNATANMLNWMVIHAKAKVMELVDKITKLVNELFQSPAVEAAGEGDADPFEEKLRTCFLLSVVVLLIVVVTRARGA
ncbi:hypothetical protein RJ639_033145 [Escallonia herrerae]|uniref:Uncharacterized protein n=1 Tax=Escallonia herrerae TaxID=1293975 RepID=A0AA88WZG0_9ASTE|nr:hypothetical protein RJ639_033145 [Escallonia herrerae]